MYYVEEQVKIIGDIIKKADPILTELVSKVKQFDKINKKSAQERDNELIYKYGDDFLEQKKKLNVSFHTEDEI